MAFFIFEYHSEAFLIFEYHSVTFAVGRGGEGIPRRATFWGGLKAGIKGGWGWGGGSPTRNMFVFHRLQATLNQTEAAETMNMQWGEHF